jgi:hypothetical protein
VPALAGRPEGCETGGEIMLLNHANMVTVLDRLVTRPNLIAASKSIGGSLKLIFTWLKRSATMTDSRFLVRFPDPQGEPVWFHQAVIDARKMHAVYLESLVRDEVTNGIQEMVVHQGALQWELDRRYVGLSAEDLAFLEIPESARYLRKRNAKGELEVVPLTLKSRLPAHLAIRTLSSLLPSFREHSTVDVNQKISGGVLILGGAEAAKVVQPAQPAPADAIDCDFSEILSQIEGPQASEPGRDKRVEVPRGGRVV